MTNVDRELVGQGYYEEHVIPNTPLGLFLETVFRKNIEDYGDGKWLTDVSTGKSMTYNQMLTAVRSVASALRKRGLKSGDTLIVIGSNFIELPLMSLAVWRAGGVQAALSVSLPQDVIEMRMREVGCKFVLTDYERAGRIVEVVKGLDFVQEVFLMGEEPMDGCTSFDVLLQDSGEECPETLNDVDMNSAVWLAYSSGTTGLAKCIVLTHNSLVGAFSRHKMLSGMNGIKYLFVNPMNNTGGFIMGLLVTSMIHFDVHCMSNFSEENLLSAIDRFKPRAVSVFPAHIAFICRYPHLERYDLSSVKSIYVMGSLVNSIYEREIFDKLPNMLFLDNNYGMSEIGLICQPPRTSPSEMASMEKAKAIARHVFGSVGKVAPYRKLKIVDVNTGEKLGPNKVGEICVKSPYAFKEYLNRPKETAEFIRDGWAYTGDKGYYDENGYVFVIGRYKELVKYRNIHVVPTNVEKFMMTHPAIQDVAVVGLPHDVDGERPLAFVVLAPGQNVTADELIVFTNEKVMDEEKLRGGIRFIDKIPRNDLGKIVRPQLMKMLTS